MRDEDVDYTDVPPIPLEAFAKAVLKQGGVKVKSKKATSLRKAAARE